jgi:3-phosphoshikimate 1-carboxyvinyltransferase
MDLYVLPSKLKDSEVSVPGDKSISHRALIFGAIAEGSSSFTGFLSGNDCLATLKAFLMMGVNIEQSDTNLTVHGVGLMGLKKSISPIDLGNSGTAVRLLTGLLSAQKFDSELIGDASLSIRPMERIIKPLKKMGAEIKSSSGCLPLKILGNKHISSISYKMPMASAQVKSSLLLASLYAEGESIIIEPSVTRDHSERMLKAMNCSIRCNNKKVRILQPMKLQPLDIRIPGDFSSAAFLIAAFLIAKKSSLILRDVGVNPTRIGFLTIIKNMGAQIKLENYRSFGDEPVADIYVQSSCLKGIEIDDSELISLAIDEFPILFVLAAYAEGMTRINGIDELRHKESDRIKSMCIGMKNLGVSLKEKKDGVVIENSEFMGGDVDSFGDHRVAMSFVVAAIGAKDKIKIKDVKNIDTSFPGFIDLMKSLGVSLSIDAPSKVNF